MSSERINCPIMDSHFPDLRNLKVLVDLNKGRRELTMCQYYVEESKTCGLKGEGDKGCYYAPGSSHISDRRIK